MGIWLGCEKRMGLSLLHSSSMNEIYEKLFIYIVLFDCLFLRNSKKVSFNSTLSGGTAKTFWYHLEWIDLNNIDWLVIFRSEIPSSTLLYGFDAPPVTNWFPPGRKELHKNYFKYRRTKKKRNHMTCLQFDLVEKISMSISYQFSDQEKLKNLTVINTSVTYNLFEYKMWKTTSTT